MKAPPASDLRARFLAAMRKSASTVTIVATDGPAGRAGITVSAMTSVSADTPQPTLLACIHHESPAALRIHANRVFCVNVLRDDQAHLSDIFAGRRKQTVPDRFAAASWLPAPSGAPRLQDALMAFDCSLASCHRIGAHDVFFGAVGEIFIADKGAPLLYINRAYSSPLPPAQIP